MAPSHANVPPATPRERAALIFLLISLIGAVYLRQRMTREHTSTTDPSTIPKQAKPPLMSPGRWLSVCCIGIGLVGALYLGWREAPAPQRINVPVIAHDLPAYHLLTTADITNTLLLGPQLPAQSLTATSELSGAISLVPLVAGHPITATQVLSITDPTLIAGTHITAVEGGPGVAFGGQLRPISTVAAWIGDRRIANRLLVLDVKPFAAGGMAGPTQRYVIILAVPSDRRSEILDAAAKGTLSFTLSP